MKKSIMVVGDVCVDWVSRDVRSETGEGCCNWQLNNGTRMEASAGGAALIASMLRELEDIDVTGYELPSLRQIDPADILHSIMDANIQSDKKIRVSSYRGYAGPRANESNVRATPPPRPPPSAGKQADLVIVDDAGNGFRTAPDVWPDGIRNESSQTFILLKMHRPLLRGPLWDHIQRMCLHRTLVVISADDLRQQGAQISRKLSWERTVEDFMSEMAGCDLMRKLAECPRVAVLFGEDGSLYLERSTEGATVATLVYDRLRIEGDFRRDVHGDMPGKTGAFVAAVAACITRDGIDNVPDALRSGLIACRRLLREGFTPDLGYPTDILNRTPSGDDNLDTFNQIRVPDRFVRNRAGDEAWSILQSSDIEVPDHGEKARSSENLYALACRIVKQGTDALDAFPVARFNNLVTADRSEIESFRSVQILMREYLANPSPERPLCFAVFGPPGSGKSFGVKQVAKSLGDKRIESVEFNLSEFGSIEQLVDSLHVVQDMALQGKVPLVFFDEFDSAFQGSPLGWLKYLLAPMQDGIFRT